MGFGSGASFGVSALVGFLPIFGCFSFPFGSLRHVIVGLRRCLSCGLLFLLFDALFLNLFNL